MKVVTLSVCVCVEGDLEDRSHKKSVFILFKSALVCNFKRQKISMSNTPEKAICMLKGRFLKGSIRKVNIMLKQSVNNVPKC